MRIVCLATRDFEDSELRDPKDAFEEAGHEVIVVAPKMDELVGKRGTVRLKPDEVIDAVQPEDFDALFIPGGFSPDQLRADPRFVDFVRAFATTDRPIVAICHGPQLLLAADALEGRRVTAWRTVQDDLRRAGIEVVDQPAVVDDNLVTSRQPSDIPAFVRAALALFERRASPRGPEREAPPPHA